MPIQFFGFVKVEASAPFVEKRCAFGITMISVRKLLVRFLNSLAEGVPQL